MDKTQRFQEPSQADLDARRAYRARCVIAGAMIVLAGLTVLATIAYLMSCAPCGP